MLKRVGCRGGRAIIKDKGTMLSFPYILRRLFYIRLPYWLVVFRRVVPFFSSEVMRFFRE